MSDFINITLQTITISLSIYILFRYQIKRNLLIAMISGSAVLGYPLYLWQGIIGVFILLLYWIMLLTLSRKNYSLALFFQYLL